MSASALPSTPPTSSSSAPVLGTGNPVNALTAGGEENAKRMKMVNEAISRSENDFSTAFGTMARDLYSHFPEKHHGVVEIVRRLDKSLLDMVNIRQWYNDKVTSATAQEVTREGRIDPSQGSTYVLPGLKIERLLFDQDFKTAMQDASRRDLRKSVAERNIKATAIIVKNLVPICILSEMLTAIASSKEADINVFGTIILRYHNMMKSWNERSERKERVLGVDNLTENTKNMALGKASESPFPNGSGISPMMVTLIRLLVMQSGTAFFDNKNINEMLDGASDDKIREASEYLEDFLVTVGVQRCIDAGEKLEDIAVIRKLRVSFVPANAEEFERESQGREVTQTVRKVPIVYFPVPAGKEMEWAGKPGHTIRPTATGNVVVMSVSSQTELEELMKVPGRSFGYIPVPLPVIHYSTDNPLHLNSEFVKTLEAQARKVVISYAPKDAEKFKKELEASAISKEVMVMVMTHVRSLPREADAVHRLVNTYNSLSIKLMSEPRYKNFSIRDVFIAILVYARTQPWVSSNPKLVAVVERIQLFAAKQRPEQTPEEEERIRTDPTYRKPVDMEEMNEMKSIVMLTLDASGNNEERHIKLVDSVFKCYIDYCRDPATLNPDDISKIYKLATTEGFFNMEMVDMVFTSATGAESPAIAAGGGAAASSSSSSSLSSSTAAPTSAASSVSLPHPAFSSHK